MSISYNNLERFWSDFYHHWSVQVWTKPNPVYTIRVRTVPSNAQVIGHTDVLPYVDKNTGRVDTLRRTLRRRTGIRVTISTSGRVGTPSWRQLFLAITTAFALLKLANMFVEEVIVKVYWRMRDTFHVSMLAEMHMRDTSKDCSKFKRMIDKRIVETSLEDVRKQRSLNDDEVSALKHIEYNDEESQLLDSGKTGRLVVKPQVGH